MKTKIKKGLLDLLTILFVVLFPHYVPLPFYSYAIICWVTVWWVLHRQNKSLRDLGLIKNGVTVKVLLAGTVSALIWVAFMRWAYLPVVRYFFIVPEYTEYNFIQDHIFTFVLITVAAWIIGGFYEEIIFRGYIQTTIENWLGVRNSFWFSGLITSVIFRLYHWQQGFLGVMAAALGGLFWTCLLKRFGRNLWYPIFSHAIFDTITLTLIYLGLFNA